MVVGGVEAQGSMHSSASCRSGFAVAVQQVKGHCKHLSVTDLTLVHCNARALHSRARYQWARAKNVYYLFSFISYLSLQ